MFLLCFYILKYFPGFSLQVHTCSGFQCNACALTFHTEATYTAHLRVEHEVASTRTYACDECEREFSAPSSLQYHRKIELAIVSGNSYSVRHLVSVTYNKRWKAGKNCNKSHLPLVLLFHYATFILRDSVHKMVEYKCTAKDCDKVCQYAIVFFFFLSALSQ